MKTSAIRKLSSLLVFFLTLFIPCQINSQINDIKIVHPLMGTISFSLASGITIPFTDYANLRQGFIWKGATGYYFTTYTNNIVAIKVFGGTGFLKGMDRKKANTEFNTPISFFGAGVNYGYRIGEEFFPSLFAGLSYLYFNPEDRNGNKMPNNELNNYSNNDVNLNFELGLQYLISEKITLDLNAGIALNFNDWLDGSVKGNNNDIFYALMLGVSYYPMADEDSDNDGVANSKDICQDTQEGVTVDEFGCPIDTDRDKVPDYLDRCPNTPASVAVDLNGCPIDSDLDGVPDYLDRCPGTIQGLEVGIYGCPIDLDRDRVPDYRDHCPNTPLGVPVDTSGCPIDTDGDSIPDYLDKCPNTPDTLKVNQYGCPIDSDEDGVPDYIDKCSNTPPNTRVTIDGCTDDFYEYIFNAETLFRTGEAILTTNAYEELDKVIDKIKLIPNSTWRIEGHTDNTGGYEFNKKLSLSRAEAVYNYFISMGLNGDMFEIIGRGEDFPIANNNSQEGRRANRRVVLIRVEQ